MLKVLLGLCTSSDLLQCELTIPMRGWRVLRQPHVVACRAVSTLECEVSGGRGERTWYLATGVSARLSDDLMSCRVTDGPPPHLPTPPFPSHRCLHVKIYL